jgi:hypothetical protein
MPEGKVVPQSLISGAGRQATMLRSVPMPFDIRLMTSAEKLEFLPEFLALADVIGDSPEENPSESVEYGAAEDFVIHSR